MGPPDKKSKQITLSPWDQLKFNSSMSFGNRYIDTGDYKKAHYYFQEAVDTDPGSTAALAKLGYTLEKLGKSEDAGRIFERMLSIDPSSVEANFHRGLSSYRKNCPLISVKYFDEVLKQNDGHLEALVYKGLSLLELGKLDEALDVFNKILTISPHHNEALTRKGLVICKTMNYAIQEDDLPSIEKIIERKARDQEDPVFLNALFYKGKILHSLQHYTEAVRFFDNILKNCTHSHFDNIRKNRIQYINALIAKGHTLLEESIDIREAHKTFCQAVEIDPKNKEALVGKAKALVLQNQFSSDNERLDAYSRVLELEPGNQEFLFNKMKILHEMGLVDEAFESAELLLVLNPSHTGALAIKGDILFARGDNEEALKIFNHVLSQKPGNLKILYKKAQILYYSKEFEEALDAFNKVIQKEPANAGALYYSASCLSELKKPGESALFFGKILKIPGGDPAVLFYKGLACCKIGLFKDACEIYHELLEQDPGHVLVSHNMFIELKNAISVSRTLKKGQAPGKDDNDNSLDSIYSGNFLLEAISSFGSLKLDKFYYALQVIVAPNIKKSHLFQFKDIKNTFTRALQSLGHCEFDFNRRIVTANPPSLVPVPASGRLARVVLTGARTGEYVKKISNFVHEKKIAEFSVIQNMVSISYNDPCAPLVHLPSTIFLTGNIAGISRVAEEFSIVFQPGEPACFSISNFSLSIEDYRKIDRPVLNNLTNWDQKFFDPIKLRFVKYFDVPEHNSVLVEYMNPRSQQFAHVYWKDGSGFMVDREWGRYLVFQDSGRGVLVYNPETGLLGVPASCPLPVLLSRAATLCSGTIPAHVTYSYPRDDTKDTVTRLTVYPGVPAEIAGMIAKKTGQDLILDTFSY